MEDEATNPAAEEELVSAEAPEVADEASDAQGDHEGDGDEAHEGQSDPDSEEVEYEGKKYAVPKELKEALLRQSDYTRKTQEVAELRRDVEAQRETAVRDAALAQELRDDYGKVHALKANVDYYGKVDWATYSAQDPSGAQQAWMVYQQAKDALNDAQKGVETKEAELRASRERDTANARAATLQQLRKDIPDFGPAKAQELATFAQSEFGVRPEELAGADARTWKLLHRAMTAESTLKGIQSKQTAAQRQAKVQAVTPAATVKGASPSDNRPRDNDDMNTWLKKREAQLKKRA